MGLSEKLADVRDDGYQLLLSLYGVKAYVESDKQLPAKFPANASMALGTFSATDQV